MTVQHHFIVVDLAKSEEIEKEKETQKSSFEVFLI